MDWGKEMIPKIDLQYLVLIQWELDQNHDNKSKMEDDGQREKNGFPNEDKRN